MLHHAIGIDAKTRLSVRLGLETGPDVHAARIEPGKERLLVPVRAVDKIEGGIEEFLIHRLHALLVERPGVLTVLLPHPPEPWVFARIVNSCRRASENATRTEAQFELRILRV